MMLASNQTEDEEVCPKNEVSAIERKTSKLDPLATLECPQTKVGSALVAWFGKT